MKNELNIDGYTAVITFDPEINQFRGEFIGLKDGADFYAASTADLIHEGRKSLAILRQVCDEEGISHDKLRCNT